MICVFGATGTVGRQVVRHLTDAGVAVRACVHDPDKAAAIAGPLVDTVPVELHQPATLERALTGVGLKDESDLALPPGRP